MAMGDSIMASNVAPFGGRGVVNIAVGGTAAIDCLNDQLPVLQQLVSEFGPPADVVVMTGTNDVPRIMGKPGYPAETIQDFLTTYRALANGILALGMDPFRVLMIGPPPQAESDTAATVEEISNYVGAVTYNAGMRNFYMGSAVGQTGNQYLIDPACTVDGVHFSTQGWAQALPPINLRIS